MLQYSLTSVCKKGESIMIDLWLYLCFYRREEAVDTIKIHKAYIWVRGISQMRITSVTEMPQPGGWYQKPLTQTVNPHNWKQLKNLCDKGEEIMHMTQKHLNHTNLILAMLSLATLLVKGNIHNYGAYVPKPYSCND